MKKIFNLYISHQEWTIKKEQAGEGYGIDRASL